jgi:hypothetical protein
MEGEMSNPALRAYIVVQATAAPLLAELVEEQIDAGYVPTGGICYTCAPETDTRHEIDLYVQAMIHQTVLYHQMDAMLRYAHKKQRKAKK